MDSLRTVPPSLFSKISSFITTASQYRNDILLAQPSKHSSDSAPKFLPNSISNLLCIKCDLTTEGVVALWEYLRDEIWAYDERETSKRNELKKTGVNEAYGMLIVYMYAWPTDKILISRFIIPTESILHQS